MEPSSSARAAAILPRSPTAIVIAGTPALAEKKRARWRRPCMAPSTPSRTVAPATPWRWSAATTPTWAGVRRQPPAPAGVDGQFHLLVGLVLGPVAGGGEAGALEGEEAVACHLDQLGDGSLDPLGAVDGDGDERQVLGEREQAIGLQPLAGAEALGAAQQDAARQLAPLEQVEHGLGEEAPAVAVVLAEVEGELQRLALALAWSLRAHRTPPSQWPRVSAASPAASERPMLSQSRWARPASPSRWDSNIQVEKVV